ncbi:hypothetical protein LAZ40_11895 [Cereibacter sphaeroides]|uniref:hypothetical protein n=1 Tax=Cereibacter sphaeroides TaxID=1063 RepID=UPI001F2DE6AF|nr:hypothetical protein [Cereibacter sphaeroides]MCE6959722.1 hypothetical protein [Cereibacter sphaeroides]MCE6974417.1 hypothetical protein [Cereibacter sphaeroides]
MLFPVIDPADTEGPATLRRDCLAVLERMGRIRDRFLKAPADPFAEVRDPLDPATRFGTLLLAAHKLARANLVPERDMDAFLEKLRNPAPKRTLVAFFGRGQESRERESLNRDAADLAFRVLETLPGVGEGTLQAGLPLSREGRDAIGHVWPVLRELAFEARKPVATIHSLEDDYLGMVAIYERFQAASFAGVDLDRVREAMTAPAVEEREPEPTT